jgi:hypothetical protein
LFYFDHYPYHNILHAKVAQVVMLPLEKNHDIIINYYLYQTSLIKESSHYTFEQTGLTSTCGYMPFVRKIANKLYDLQKSNAEIGNFLESIPEWDEYY